VLSLSLLVLVYRLSSGERRGSLFTLVDIAGEDDIDALDLGANPTPQRNCRDHRTIASKRMGKLRQRNGQ
jgi:hypothetical protein